MELIASVYKFKRGDTTTKFTAPAVVVLSEPFTEGDWYDPDSQLQLSNMGNVFNIDVGIENSVQYQTTDGITWTLTGGVDVLFELDTSVTFDDNQYGEWDDVMGNFVTRKTDIFDGLYEWKNEIDEEYYNAIDSCIVDTSNNTVSTTNTQMYLPNLKAMIDKITNEQYSGSKMMEGMVVVYDTTLEEYHIYVANNGSGCQIIHDNTYIILNYQSAGSARTIQDYLVDLDTMTYEKTDISTNILYTGNWGGKWAGFYIPNTNKVVASFWHGDAWSSARSYNFQYMTSTDVNPPTLTKSGAYHGHTPFLTWHKVKALRKY